MPTTSNHLTGAYLALAIVDSWLAGSQRRRAARIRALTKPLLMPTLAASLLAEPRAAASPFRTTTLLAQAFGWGGDVALLRHGTRAFAVGAASFGAGHMSYLTGFRAHSTARPLFRSTAGQAGPALFLAGGPVMAIGAARQEPVLGPAVLTYTGLLSALVAHAGHLEPALGPRSRRLTLAGAGMFAASDTLLGLRKFWWPTAPARTESVVMGSYALGQLLLSKGAAAAYRQT